MISNKKILLIGGAVVLAYILLKNKKNTKIEIITREKSVPFAPINVQKMPWVSVPDSIPQIN
jgi:hypothetical protein